MAVVVSEEQGEVEKFRKWELDIRPHRRLLKEGFSIPEHLRRRPEFQGIQRLDPDSAFKEAEHPFRIAIVCAMWLTGFDVPSLATIYPDKPLKAEKLKIDHWRDKESSRDAVRIAIRDFLWNDATGLPVEAYSEDDVTIRTEDVFRHVYRVYPTLPSPYYAAAA